MIEMPRSLLLHGEGRPEVTSGTDSDAVILPFRAPLFRATDETNTIDTLRTVLAAGATGIALAACRNGGQIQRLAVLLSVAEAEEGIEDGTTRILAVTDGILPSPGDAHGFSGKSARLAALVWDHAALSAALGASRMKTAAGEWAGAFALARASVLLAAHAADLPAYDTACDSDADAFRNDCSRSRADGFFGRIARGEAEAREIDAIYRAV